PAHRAHLTFGQFSSTRFRRSSRRVDHLHALLSGASPCGLRLQPYPRKSSKRLDASANPLGGSVAVGRRAFLPRSNLGLTPYSRRVLEARTKHRPCAWHPRGSGNRCRPAVLRSFHHRPPVANVGSARRTNHIPLPPL